MDYPAVTYRCFFLLFRPIVWSRPLVPNLVPGALKFNLTAILQSYHNATFIHFSNSRRWLNKELVLVGFGDITELIYTPVIEDNNLDDDVFYPNCSLPSSALLSHCAKILSHCAGPEYSTGYISPFTMASSAIKRTKQTEE